MAELNWQAYYAELRRRADAVALPVYGEGEPIDWRELGSASLRLQEARDWFTAAYAHAQENLQASKRKLNQLRHRRKMDYNAHILANPSVLTKPNREERVAMANWLCHELDEQIAAVESDVVDWEAARETVEQYITTLETAKVTLGRIQRSAVAEMENLRGM